MCTSGVSNSQPHGNRMRVNSAGLAKAPLGGLPQADAVDPPKNSARVNAFALATFPIGGFGIIDSPAPGGGSTLLLKLQVQS